MKYIRSFLSYFTAITTAILVIVSLDAAVSSYHVFSKYLPIQVLGAGAVTALVTTLILCREINTRKQFLFLSAIHYVMLCGVMIALGMMFGWIDISIGSILGMVLYVAIVYALVFVINYVLAKNEADKLNEALDKRKNDRSN